MKCPHCLGNQLVSESLEDVTIDRCPACGGIWFDVLELEKILEADPRSLLAEDAQFKAAANEAGPPRECPRCGPTPMIKLNSRQRSGTIVDSCTVCFGTWLDAGELTRLAHGDLPGRLRGLFGG